MLGTYRSIRTSRFAEEPLDAGQPCFKWTSLPKVKVNKHTTFRAAFASGVSRLEFADASSPVEFAIESISVASLSSGARGLDAYACASGNRACGSCSCSSLPSWLRLLVVCQKMGDGGEDSKKGKRLFANSRCGIIDGGSCGGAAQFDITVTVIRNIRCRARLGRWLPRARARACSGPAGRFLRRCLTEL
jgi:hypothetical protein